MTNYQEILRHYWGYEDFRGIQKDIIESIGAGHDTLGLMPTGGGKSITFQVPAMAMQGVCIVVTPLIALMKDQVNGLRRRGIKATSVNSGMTVQPPSDKWVSCAMTARALSRASCGVSASTATTLQAVRWA